MTELFFYCDNPDCDHRPFVVSQEQFIEAGYQVNCEYCGEPCKFSGDDLRVDELEVYLGLSDEVHFNSVSHSFSAITDTAGLNIQEVKILIARLNQWVKDNENS